MSDPDGPKFDVIVVGVGSIRSASYHYFSKKSVKLLGIEEFAIPHAHGSHHENSRMIRTAYYGFWPTGASEKYHPDDRIDDPPPGRQVQP